MYPQDILKLKSSEINGKVHFSTCFCIFKVTFKVCIQGGQPSYMKRGTIPESLKSGGHIPPVPPVPMSMVLPVQSRGSARNYKNAMINSIS